MKILIIEDEIGRTDALKDAFTVRGYDAVIVNNYTQYLEEEKIGLNRFDVVILDLMLPRPSGVQMPENYEVGEVIYNRIIKIIPTVRVIITSALSRDNINLNVEGDNTVILSKPTQSKMNNIIKNIEKY